MINRDLEIKVYPDAIEGCQGTIEDQPDAIEGYQGTIGDQPDAIEGYQGTIGGSQGAIEGCPYAIEDWLSPIEGCRGTIKACPDKIKYRPDVFNGCAHVPDVFYPFFNGYAGICLNTITGIMNLTPRVKKPLNPLKGT